MALLFPSSPSLNQTYQTGSSAEYTWNGYYWVVSNGFTGTSGTSGAQGNQGPQGVQGTNGVIGSNGTSGAQGPQGNQGPAGSGAQGAQGPTGGTGPQGNQGNQGPQGNQGTQGTTFNINQYSGSVFVTGSLTVSSAIIVSSSMVANTSSLYLTSGSNLYVQNNGLVEITGSLSFSGSSATINVPVLNVGTGSALEGGEIDLAYAQTTSLTGSSVAFDVYGDKIRIFEGGGNSRGVSIDLSKAPSGVGGELMWKASGLVNRGVDVTLGNLKARIPATGNISLQLSTVSGTYSVYGSGIYTQSGTTVGNTIDGASPRAISTTPAYLNSGYNFGTSGATDTWNIMDTSNSIAWRITMILGAGVNNNLISIERIL